MQHILETTNFNASKSKERAEGDSSRSVSWELGVCVRVGERMEYPLVKIKVQMATDDEVDRVPYSFFR